MKELRILFTGVGRRIELIKAFREAAYILNIDLKIYGADMTGTAPALAYCDYTKKICGMRDPNYIPDLLAICEQEKIDLVIPTIDTDLLVLSQNVGLFKDTKILISDYDMISICRDKNFTADFFEKCGCRSPKTVNNWKEYKEGFPCFIKPKDGSSSVNTFKVENVEDLQTYANQIDDYIIQPFIDGTEYTVDIFCDFNGTPIYITPRIRLQVRAGEVLKTKISNDEIIIEECMQLIQKFKPVGPMTVQLIRKESTGENYYIEINPRFGGGAPLSMKAGARSAEALLSLLVGETIKKNKISDGAIYSRFDNSVCIEENNGVSRVRGVVFDLDDTLYSEKDYIKSGYMEIEKYLKKKGAADKMWKYFEEGLPAIDKYLEEIGRIEEKGACVSLYRNHCPNISMYDGVEDFIIKLKRNGIKVGIITDGRPVGQRNKLLALGLYDVMDDIIITDELGGEDFRKPCDIAFRIIQRKWKLPYEELLYIGDNARKDFQAPKQLGMQWIYINNVNGIYSQSIDTFDESMAMWTGNMYKSISDIVNNFNTEDIV